jgi:hypothetical protein
MDMIDQYLDAVAAQLPEAERADIVAELREMILSSFEAKESQLHRALKDDERLEILRAIGHPLVVAARYRKGPEALIGPELFPYWLFAVKAGLLVQAALFALSLVLGLLSDPQHVTRDLMQAIHDYFWAAMALIGVTTLVGAVLEHNKIKPRWMTQWRINDLKVFSLPSNWILPAETWKPAGRAAARAVRRKLPGAEHIVPLVACVIFLLWWTGLVPFEAWTHMRRRDQDILVAAAPIWTTLHGVILIFVLAQLASHLFGLLRPHAIRLQAMLEIALACAGLGILWTVYQAGHLATLSLSQGTQTARVEVTELTLDREAWRALEGRDDWFPKLAASLSMTISWVMAIIAVVTLVKIARALLRLGRA